ncbi:uncharacterized protein LOC128509000 [Clarias gariepinus]|uniref:uncharacterized protein LOC128509000 n=1 Tax=Clarias gariepinus TaxID=13013 RepID=UPI00234D870C|nr:uncharacterized protein LOC128509000 [Clarias gariepinus]
MSHVVTPGEPIHVHLPLTDQVEVSFTASDAAQPSNLQICTMKKEKLECKPDYQATVSRLNILQIRIVNVSHSGTYTVRDLAKNQTIAIVTVEVRGSVTDKLHHPVTLSSELDLRINKETCIPVWAIPVTVVILLIIMGSLFIYQCRKNQQPCAESASNRPQQFRMIESNNERQQSRVTENTSHNPGDEGMSEETALNEEQQ